MFDPQKFTTTQAKPLPLILLLDVSYSMSGDKIDNLNRAVEDMLNSFAKEEKMETEILVSVITFGSEVELHIPYTKASQVSWKSLQANGMTFMGTALKMAKAMIEDKDTTPSRAYRPTIILVSDGQPNDSWEGPLDDFITDGRSSKCDRMAMAIGDDANTTVLKRFINGTLHDLFTAENAGKMHEFFQRVTMSITMRTQSKNPNMVPGTIELDESVEANFSTSVVFENDDQGYWQRKLKNGQESGQFEFSGANSASHSEVQADVLTEQVDITTEGARNTRKFVGTFIRSYRDRASNLSNTQWLCGEFAKYLEIWGDEIAQIFVPIKQGRES